LHGAIGQWLAYAADVAQVSVIVCKFIVLNLPVITLSAFVLNLWKLSEVIGLKTVLVLVENWWFRYSHFVLLMSLFFRDVAELEEVSLGNLIKYCHLVCCWLASKWNGLHMY